MIKKLFTFTLIELLVVIAIIAILASLMLPVIPRIMTNSRITEAKAQMRLIETAVNAYESEYLVMPWTDGASDLNSGSANDAVWYGASGDQCRYYDKLMELLTCANSPDSYGLRNLHQTRFLQPPEKFSQNGMIDFWGNRFGIAMDLNGDNQISGSGTPLDGQNGKIFLWSFGPNKLNEWGDKISPRDDIPLWQ